MRARSIHEHQEQENGEENNGKRREAMDYNWDQIVEGHACIEGRESEVDSAEQARKEALVALHIWLQRAEQTIHRNTQNNRARETIHRLSVYRMYSKIRNQDMMDVRSKVSPSSVSIWRSSIRLLHDRHLPSPPLPLSWNLATINRGCPSR